MSAPLVLISTRHSALSRPTQCCLTAALGCAGSRAPATNPKLARLFTAPTPFRIHPHSSAPTICASHITPPPICPHLCFKLALPALHGVPALNALPAHDHTQLSSRLEPFDARISSIEPPSFLCRCQHPADLMLRQSQSRSLPTFHVPRPTHGPICWPVWYHPR